MDGIILGAVWPVPKDCRARTKTLSGPLVQGTATVVSSCWIEEFARCGTRSGYSSEAGSPGILMLTVSTKVK